MEISSSALCCELPLLIKIGIIVHDEANALYKCVSFYFSFFVHLAFPRFKIVNSAANIIPKTTAATIRKKKRRECALVTSLPFFILMALKNTIVLALP